jgi:AraC family transcriptional regulator of adaptative response / DNA-3-methyladenine glycosylase II
MIRAVVTTGIYCVARCPARPKPENVRRYATPAEARAAGFRACQRCRPDEAKVELTLPHSGPLDAAGLIAFLGRRAVPGVEELAGGAYRRSLRLANGPGVAELSAAAGGVNAHLWLADPADRDEAVGRCRTLLALDADPSAAVEALGDDALLGPLVRAAPGRRVPGHADAHELAFRAVLGQQVTLAGAASAAGKLTAAHGQPLDAPFGTITHLFPTAEALAEADTTDWPMPRSRRAALSGLAAALASGSIELDRVGELPGIGPWTASYIAMRALRDPDAFLPTDAGVRRGLEALGRDGSPRSAESEAAAWRPYRAWAIPHLWAAAA